MGCIYLHTSAADSAVVEAAATQLHIPKAAAYGLLIMLWCGVALHFKNGDLRAYRDLDAMDEWMEFVSGWRGTPGEFARFVRANCIRDGIMMPEKKVVRWRYPYGGSSAPRPPIPQSLRAAVYERDGFQCVNCLRSDTLSLDHIMPFSHGGADTYENLRTLCVSCNSRRGAARCDF